MGAKVLVVDDSWMTRLQVRRALEEAGFSMVEACDGIDACDKLAENADVSLILCDVNMPRMSGLEFLEQLGAMGKAAIPLVLLTTDSQPELVRRAKQLGAKGWIIKPFQPQMLVALAKRLSATDGPTGPTQAAG